MNMTNCKHCNVELTHIEGRKQKYFCNVNCRNKYFYSERSKLIKNAKAAIRGLPDEMKEGITHVGILSSKGEIINKEEIRIPINDEIQSQINAIKSEKIPDYRNTAIGRKIWQNEQNAKVAELQKLL